MTAYDITHGVGGLWETHQWNGGIVLNTQDGPDRIHITTINGMHKLPDRDDPRAPKVARIGENAYPTSPAGKTVSYVGQIQHSTLPLLRTARTALIAAFAGTVSEGYMDVIPHASIGGPTARYYAKVLDLDPPEEVQGVRGFDRNFQLDLRMSDPRFYFPSLAVDSTGNPVSVTNAGSAPADPIITIAGVSGAAVTVTDGTRTLSFPSPPAGTLIIDFKARTAKVGTDVCMIDPAASDWWHPYVEGIAGGATVSIAQTGGTGVRAQFTPSTWA